MEIALKPPCISRRGTEKYATDTAADRGRYPPQATGKIKNSAETSPLTDTISQETPTDQKTEIRQKRKSAASCHRWQDTCGEERNECAYGHPMSCVSLREVHRHIQGLGSQQ